MCSAWVFEFGISQVSMAIDLEVVGDVVGDGDVVM